MATPTPPTNPPKATKQTLRQRNEQSKNAEQYDVGAVPAQVLSSDMRLAYTSKVYLETVDFESMVGLRESINALELLQTRRKAWLSGNCVDIPVVYTYKSQPRAVRHRINLLLNSDTNHLFDDPVVPGHDYASNEPFDPKDEQRADAKFNKILGEVYRSQPKLWKRIRAREFTLWPMHTSRHFVTLIIRMRRSDPYADPSTPYDEVAQFAVLEPAYNQQVIKRIHRRLRGILSKDGIKVPTNAYRAPWYPTQRDDYSCGLRSYIMAKEFMERLTLIYGLLPVVFHATNMPVVLSKSSQQDLKAPLEPLGGASVPESVSSAGSAMDMDPDPKLGAKDPNRRINEAKFQRMLWEYPFNGYVNENAVRDQMIGAVACVALDRYDYQARAAIVPIDSVTDADLVLDEEIRHDLLKDPKQKHKQKQKQKKKKPEDDDDASPAKVYAPGDLRPQRTGRVQRFHKAQQSFNPVQNPHSAPLDAAAALDGFANITISGTAGAYRLKHGNFAGPMGAQQAGAGKKQLTASQWQKKNKGNWKQGRLRKAKRHDRYGPAFLNVPAFRKALWDHANR